MMFVESEMNFVIDENHCYGTNRTGVVIKKDQTQNSSSASDGYDTNG